MMKVTEMRRAREAGAKRRNLILWSAFAVLLVILPLISSSSWLETFTAISIMAVFALSYNMLFGQGGMLSFGHAVYFGLGGFFAVHTMNQLGNSWDWSEGWAIPVILMPIIGGIFGMLFGIIFGSFSTKKGETVFAMISLGIVELIAASAVIFVTFFGGEEGKSTDRSNGPDATFFNDILGHDMGVYYFAAFWFFVGTYLMYRFSRTPAGRMANAVRDNHERAEFIGYNPRYVRYVSFIAAGFFAGVAGGMGAVKLEFMSIQTVIVQSGLVLFAAYVGGALFFAGPILGAVIIVLMNNYVSVFTELSSLYMSIIFVIVVLAIPAGVTGFILMHIAAVKTKRLAGLMVSYLIMLVPLSIVLFSFIGIIEMFHFSHQAAVGDTVATVFWTKFDTASPVIWSIFFALLFVGIAGCHVARSFVTKSWEGINDAINAAEMKKAKEQSEPVGEKVTA